MCGIGGLFQYRLGGAPIAIDELHRIMSVQKTRGPDAKGEWTSSDYRVLFGHQRLSIIDLSSHATQPMHTEDGRYVIVFNGEIYNYQALRTELAEGGAIFRTRSDTEVVLHGYRVWGDALFTRLRGMFAFAIWDNLKRRLLLVRDPYGIKPLYIADNGGTLRFASQVKALLAGGNVPTSPDSAGVVGFLMMGSVPDPYTVYKSIRAVPAGHYIYATERGASKPQQYFSIQDIWREASERSGQYSAEDIQEEVSSALLDSVRHHMVADVTTGAFLSAGIDSGAITGLMRDAGAPPVQCITLGFREYQGTDDDESLLAGQVARDYRCKHEVHWVEDRDFQDGLPNMLRAMDQPSVDGINTWLVSKAASQSGLKVVLSGVGGDELFGGYSNFRELPLWLERHRKARKLKLATSLTYRLARFASYKKMLPAKAPGLIRYGESIQGLYFVRRGLFMPWELSNLVDSELVREGLEQLQPPNFIADQLGQVPGHNFASVASLEAIFYLRNQLLRDSDWASMSHSLELRTPLVDSHLLARLAPMLVSRPESVSEKAPLAKAPERPLNKDVIARKKTGFSTPMARWLENSDALGEWKSNGYLKAGNVSWGRKMAYSMIAKTHPDIAIGN